MSRLAFFYVLSLCVGLAVACSTSTNTPGNSSGSGAGSGAGCTVTPAEAGASCSVQSTTSMCGMGNTCCLGTPVPSTGNCVPAGTCNSPFQFECHFKSECGCDQNCCATFIVPDAGTDDASPGALLAILQMSQAKSECKPTCPSDQTPLCSSDTDCPSGMSCKEFFSAGDAGALVSGLLMSFKGCF